MSVIKNHIRKMSAYHPPLEGRNPKEFTLLDFNERTVGISAKVKDAVKKYVDEDLLQVYPSYGSFNKKLADYAGVDESCMMFTNGSDQGIDMVIRSCCDTGDEAIIPVPSFAMYYQSAQVQNLKIIEPAYTLESGYPTEKVIDAINDNTRLIVISNPNNPTGTQVSQEEILKIAASAPDAAILVDECYYEYTKETVIDYIEQYKNLFVTRTFSKTWGLPSVRLGFLVSSQENIEDLLKVRGPYDINQFAEIAVSAALENPSYVEEYLEEVLNKAKPMLEEFLTSKGVEFWPSSANFIFTFPENPEAINQKLVEQGILVRPKKDAAGNLGLRLGIGTVGQTKKLIDALEKLL